MLGNIIQSNNDIIFFWNKTYPDLWLIQTKRDWMGVIFEKIKMIAIYFLPALLKLLSVLAKFMFKFMYIYIYLCVWICKHTYILNTYNYI